MNILKSTFGGFSVLSCKLLDRQKVAVEKQEIVPFFILRCHFAVLSVIDSYETKKVLLFMITEYVDYCFLPAGIYLLKVNNRNTKTKCEIYSKGNNKDTWCLYC